MPIQFFKLKRKIIVNSVAYERYVPKMQVETIVGFEKIAEMIEKKSSMSRGDILGVLAELEESTFWLLENGHPVNLGLLGTFYPSITVKSVDSPEKITSKLITRFRILFKPSKYFKKRLKNVEFVLGDSEVRGVNYKKK